MVQMEWVILISASLAILSIIMFLICLMSFLGNKQKLLTIKNNKPQKKRSQRKWRRDLQKTTTAKKSSGRNTLLFFLLLVLSTSVGGYSKYYQMTNMTKGDTENIVSGYYLLGQVEEQLTAASKENSNAEQLSSNIHTLAVRIASFSAKKGNDRASEEGQLLMNRYYARMGQFGINLSSQDYQELVTEPETLKNYFKDIEGIKQAQKKLLDFYKIDEASLNQKK